MTIAEIRAYLEENKDDVEVKAYLAETAKPRTATPEDIGEFLKTEDGRLLVQPMIDSAVTKAVKTRDKAHEVTFESEMKKRLSAEILKMNPQEEPWQKELREVKETLEKEKSERAKDQLKRQLLEEAVKLQVDPFYFEDYLPESIEQGRLFIQKIQAREKALKEQVSNETLATSFKPGSGSERPGKIDLTKLSQAEIVKLEMEGKLDEQIAG